MSRFVRKSCLLPSFFFWSKPRYFGSSMIGKTVILLYSSSDRRSLWYYKRPIPRSWSRGTYSIVFATVFSFCLAHTPLLQSNSIATSFFEKLILSVVMQQVSTKTKRKSASVKIKGDSLLWKLWTCVGGGVEPHVWLYQINCLSIGSFVVLCQDKPSFFLGRILAVCSAKSPQDYN